MTENNNIIDDQPHTAHKEADAFAGVKAENGIKHDESDATAKISDDAKIAPAVPEPSTLSDIDVGFDIAADVCADESPVPSEPPASADIGSGVPVLAVSESESAPSPSGAVSTPRRGVLRKLLLITPLFLIVCAFAAAGIFAFFVYNDIGGYYREELVYPGVTCFGAELSGKTYDETLGIVAAKIEAGIPESGMTLKIGGRSYVFEAEHIKKAFDAAFTAQAAFSYGREISARPDVFESMELYFGSFNAGSRPASINDAVIESFVSKVTADFKGPDSVSSITETDGVITVYKGEPYFMPDADDIRTKTYAALLPLSRRESMKAETESAALIYEPEAPDFEAAAAELYIAPVNAAIYEDENGYPHISEAENGRSVSAEALKAAYDSLLSGRSALISFEEVAPEIYAEDLSGSLEPYFYKELLGSYRSEYSASAKNRTTNLRLACEKLNGVIVMPGEVFSYNATLGKRTAAAGFKPASVIKGGKLVDELGGGICQISSNLYAAASLYANLPAVEYYNHGNKIPYMPVGMDATVYWGSLDYKFKNDRDAPIKIVAYLDDEKQEAVVEIWGTNSGGLHYEVDVIVLSTTAYTTVTTEDPTLDAGITKVTQGGRNGHVTETYLNVFNEAGEQVDRLFISKNFYSPMKRYITVGTKTDDPVTPDPDPSAAQNV